VERVLVENALQVALSENDYVIEAFASNATKESLAHGIHQRCLYGCSHYANSDARGDAIEVCPKLVVAIANENLRPLSEGRGIAQLLRRPSLAARACHSNVNDALGVLVDDKECEDRTKPDVVSLKEVAGPDRMIAQERPPRLAVMPTSAATAAHVLLHRALRNADSKFQELAADSLRSPKAVSPRHASDEIDHSWIDSGFRLARALRTPAPHDSESFTMPAKDRLGLQ